VEKGEELWNCNRSP